MWTVVVVSFIASVSNNGQGSSTAIDHMDFNSQVTCEAAAKALTVPQTIMHTKNPPDGWAAKYQVIATCVPK